MKIRKPETEELQKKANAVLFRAFKNSKYEENLVINLRKNGKELHEWVAIIRKMVVGYVALTNAYKNGEKIGYHLAPVAVHPDFQRSGIGSELIRFALRQADIKDQPIFVLGAPKYYERFGFKFVKNPICKFDKNNRHFLAINFDESAEKFTVGYEKEFKG